jgi:predicted nucleic-acid-binding protein
MQVADTNVLVRALVHDSSAPEQSRLAQSWLSEQTLIYVPQVVQLELVWILDRAFGFARDDIVRLLQRLYSHSRVRLQSPHIFTAALVALRDGGDFGDGIIAAESVAAGARVVTFDRNFAKWSQAQLLL